MNCTRRKIFTIYLGKNANTHMDEASGQVKI